MANPIRHRFRMVMEFDTPISYERFRVIALKEAIAMQVPNGIELVYLATRTEAADFDDTPVDCR